MKSGYLRSAIITLGSFLFVITAVTAWTGPGGNPPNNNVAAPLSVSGTAQHKSGPLGINTNNNPQNGFGLAVSGNAAISGKIYVGQSTVDADPGLTTVTKDYLLSKVGGGADTLGNHTATQNLNMSNFKITNMLNPTDGQDGATKAYVDTKTVGTLKSCKKVTLTPNLCQWRQTINCGAGEIAISGGGTARDNSSIAHSYPSSDLKSWTIAGDVVTFSGATTGATGCIQNVFAVCCLSS